VTEPERDHGGVNASLKQRHGATVPQDMRVDGLSRQRRVPDDVLDRIENIL
jgi:hypothetical protein